MHQFHIHVRSFQQIHDFVSLAMIQPFEVLVGNEKHQVNGKSFIGMFTLDYKRPLKVSVKCTDEEFAPFHQAASQIFV